MKTNKKILSVVTASAIALTSFAPTVFAADRDMYNKSTGKSYEYSEYMSDEKQFNELVNATEEDASNFIWELDGKGYNYSSLLEKYIETKDYKKTLEEAKKEELPSETPDEGELKVESVRAINGSQLKVTLSTEVDSASKDNFSIEGITVVSAELNTDNKKEVIVNISGAELGKSYSLVATGLKVNGESQEVLTENFTMPSVESLYNAKLSISDERTVVKADGADSVLVTFTLTDTNGVEVEDNNMEVAFAATFGTFAEKRVTVQNGKATALFNSEVLDTDRDALLTATVVEASDKNLINVKAEKTLLLSPNPEQIEDDNVGATLTDVAAEMADRVILYFNKDVDVADYVKKDTKAEYDVNKLEISVQDNVKNDLTGGTSKTVKGLKAVPGNSKALYAILDTTSNGTLTDNSRIKVEVKDKTGKPHTDSTKSTVLTDARRPSILGVSRDGLNKVVVTFSEPVKDVNTSGTIKDSSEELENWVIDGVRLDGTKWGASTTEATATVGSFNVTTGEDARHIVTIELGKDSDGKQIYFTPGTHAIQGANMGDWANRTDNPNNVINTQTLDFEVPQDNEAPTATVEVQSPEQYVVTFNKVVNQDLATDLELQKYNADTKEWEKETTQTINVRQLSSPDENKFVVETKQDWTQVYNTSVTNKNYYNDSYRLFIPEGKVTNASNGKENSKIELLLMGAMKTPDVTSPEISIIEEEIKGQEYTVTMSEPVKFPVTGGGNGDSWETKAETQTSIPTPTAQFIKKDGSKTIDADVTQGTDEYNKEITVKPQGNVELEGGVWTLVVRSISDDVGNTAASATKDFTVEKEVVSDNFRVVWTAADSDNDYTSNPRLTEIASGNGKDAVYVKFSQPVKTTGGSSSALTTTNYTLNGDPLPKGTQIVSNIKNYDDVDNKIDSVTIILPDGTLTESIESTVITVSPYIQNADGESLSNGGQFKLPYNHEASTVTTVSDFEDALADESIRSIDATGVNLSAEDVVVSRLVDITFANNVQSVTVNTTEGGQMEITGGTITGDLTVNTPNADFTNSSTVSGTTTIKDVASSTFVNNGTLGAVVIEDSNGTAFENASGATVRTVKVDTAGTVKLEGAITNVEVTKAAKLKVEGTVTNLDLKAEAKGVKVELGTDGSAQSVTNNTGETVVVGKDEVVYVDRSILKTKIEDAEKLKAEDYTQESWDSADLSNVISAAKTELANAKATQAEVDAQVANIKSSIEKLVKKGDETAPEVTEATYTLNGESKNLKEENYTINVPRQADNNISALSIKIKDVADSSIKVTGTSDIASVNINSVLKDNGLSDIKTDANGVATIDLSKVGSLLSYIDFSAYEVGTAKSITLTLTDASGNVEKVDISINVTEAQQ